MISEKIIVTCGTNGKTTSNNLINSLIVSNGYKTVCNSVGANMLPGVATAFVSSVGINGKLKCEYAVIEIDEASAVKVFEHFTPDIIHITNLFRDQLDRYGEIDLTADYLMRAIEKAPDAKLIINADDPLLYSIAVKCEKKPITYGINDNASPETDEIREGRFCQICGAELKYNFYHYSQLGDYYCPSCGFSRPEINYRADNVNLTSGISFIINGKKKINADYRGFYNIYNILSCFAVCDFAGVDTEKINDVLSGFRPQAGRMERFDLGKPVILNLSKNPAGFNQGINTVINEQDTKDVIIMINDNAQDGKDISWIWDVNFENLKSPDIGTVILTGIRKDDLAVRFKYAETGKETIVCDTLEKAVRTALLKQGTKLYVLVNYTAVFDANMLLKKLEKENGRVRNI